MNYLAKYDADTLPDLDRCIVTETGSDSIAFTRVGGERFKTRFAKAGFDIDKIGTREELRTALEASFHIEMEEFAGLVASRGEATIERKLLVAIALGDDIEAQRLEKLIARRNQWFTDGQTIPVQSAESETGNRS